MNFDLSYANEPDFIGICALCYRRGEVRKIRFKKMRQEMDLDSKFMDPE